MSLVDIILRPIFFTYSLLIFNCTNVYLNDLNEYNNLNKELNVCEIMKSDERFKADVGEFVTDGVEDDCKFNLTTSMCNDIFDEIKRGFLKNVNSTIYGFNKDEIDMTLPHENCIKQMIMDHHIYLPVLKLLSTQRVTEENENENKNNFKALEYPIRLTRSICMGDELYSEKFETHRHDIRNISDVDICNVQFLIDRGFVIGNLSEIPLNCHEQNAKFERFLNSNFLLRSHPFSDFFASSAADIQECFLKKTLEQNLPHQLVGIDYSYAIRAPEYNIEDEKKKFIELMKLKDKIALQCLILQ